MHKHVRMADPEGKREIDYGKACRNRWQEAYLGAGDLPQVQASPRLYSFGFLVLACIAHRVVPLRGLAKLLGYLRETEWEDDGSISTSRGRRLCLRHLPSIL
jgi:hypothetical protein